MCRDCANQFRDTVVAVIGSGPTETTKSAQGAHAQYCYPRRHVAAGSVASGRCAQCFFPGAISSPDNDASGRVLSVGRAEPSPGASRAQSKSGRASNAPNLGAMGDRSQYRCSSVGPSPRVGEGEPGRAWCRRTPIPARVTLGNSHRTTKPETAQRKTTGASNVAPARCGRKRATPSSQRHAQPRGRDAPAF